jgi:DNA modification methylase
MISKDLLNSTSLKPWPPVGIKWYFHDDWVAIAHGDCREILPSLPKVDLVLTSPPYDNLREYGGYAWDFKDTANKLYTVITDGGVIVWVVGDATIDGSETGSSFKQALYFKELGLNLHDTMIYLKDSPPQNQKRYEQCFEYMFILSRCQPKTFNPIKRDKLWVDKRKTKAYQRDKMGNFGNGIPLSSDTDAVIYNAWHYDVGGGHVTNFKPAYEHPAIFPEKLAYDHIISWSNPDDLVLDPFLGSGTTAYCAKKLGRRCIGIEIEEKYCEIAAKRCMQSVMQLEIPKEKIEQGRL